YEPLVDEQGRVRGMRFVGQPLSEISALRRVLQQSIGKSGYPFIVDPQGRLALHPRRELIGKHLIEDLQLTPFKDTLTVRPGESGVIEYVFEKRRKFAAYVRLDNGWIAYISGYSDEMQQAIREAARARLLALAANMERFNVLQVEGQSMPLYSQIRWLDADGAEVIRWQNGEAASDHELRDQSATAWFQQAKQAQGVLCSRIEQARNTGKPELRVIAPIDGPQARIGYAVLNINWQAVNRQMGSHRYGETGYPWMIDSEGWFTIHPKLLLQARATEERFGALAAIARDMISGKEGIGEYEWEGKGVIVAYRPFELGGHRYSLAMRVGADEALRLSSAIAAESRRTMRQSLWIMAVCLIVIVGFGIAVGLWQARRLTRPLAAT
ncbi:MAG: cache domain-containing protein, partial [Rhodocyclaceae bacterium]|nr:cache domain-containing protein [Rhodocyclaceae bacterium]